MGYFKRFWQPKQEELTDKWTPEPVDPLTTEEIRELNQKAKTRRYRIRMNKPTLRRLEGERKAYYQRLIARSKGYSKPGIRPYNGLIYFVERPGKFVKIGHTTRLNERLRDIKRDWPGALLLGVLKGLPDDEKQIQKIFYQFRDPDRESKASGYTEWFYLVKPIRFFIKHFCGNKPQ